MQHELKIWPEFFKEVLNGNKRCEIRLDDRGFHYGDTLLLREWRPGAKEYTGRSVEVVVTHLLCGPAFGLVQGYVAMSIELVPGDVR